MEQIFISLLLRNRSARKAKKSHGGILQKGRLKFLQIMPSGRVGHNGRERGWVKYWTKKNVEKYILSSKNYLPRIAVT